MEILLFGAKVDTVIESNTQEEGDVTGGGGLDNNDGTGTWT